MAADCTLHFSHISWWVEGDFFAPAPHARPSSAHAHCVCSLQGKSMRQERGLPARERRRATAVRVPVVRARGLWWLTAVLLGLLSGTVMGQTSTTKVISLNQCTASQVFDARFVHSLWKLLLWLVCVQLGWRGGGALRPWRVSWLGRWRFFQKAKPLLCCSWLPQCEHPPPPPFPPPPL